MQPLSSKQLLKMVKTCHEKNIQIVDVRPENEFALDHIPGAVNVPLTKLQQNPQQFNETRKLVFCCRNGIRSKVAAFLVSECGYPDHLIFNLTGGISEYTGELLLELPRIECFDTDAENILQTALALEKGAWIFYSRAVKIFKETPPGQVFKKMVGQEVKHARSIFKAADGFTLTGQTFETVFDKADTSILEGGFSMETAMDLFTQADSMENICHNMMDFAIEMEYRAYDLYKTAANSSRWTDFKKIFLNLSQSEKKHMEILIQALDQCC